MEQAPGINKGNRCNTALLARKQAMANLSMLKLLILAVLGALALPGAIAQDEFTTAASWIWYPERPAVEGAGQTRYLRRVVRLAERAVEASIWVMADDSVTFMVNGRAAPKPVETGAAWALYDLKDALSPGDNVLGFAVKNAGGPGGLLVRGVIVDAKGAQNTVLSDASFRASREAPEGWASPGFDASAWPAAAIIGSVFASPWFTHPAFDLKPFLLPGELDRYRAWLTHLTSLPPGLDGEPKATASLGRVRGHTALTINGAPRPALIYRGTVDPLTSHGRQQIGLFRDAGVHVYTAYWPLAQCWPEPGRFTFERLDDTIRAYLSTDPEAYLILILRLVPPPWWMDRHPDQMVAYAAGSDFNSSDECWRVRRPSYASKLWRADIMALWRACVEHIEDQPWGKRVIGYQPGYGIYTEWHYFGSWTNQMPDTGPAMTAHFRSWLRERYGTVERLRAAWRDPAASFDTAEVPGVDPRLAADALGLRDPAQRRPVMDYYLCQQELTADLIEDFCRTAKDATGGRTVAGVFYGYFHGVPPQTQGGHLELQRLLKSPWVDYFAAPYDYSFRLMGQDGRLRCLPEAFSLAGKTHLVEADTRTYLHPTEEHGRTPDATSSIAAIRRELSTALISSCALWWCDFGADGLGGWYDDPALIGEVGALVRLAERRMKRPRESVAQVAVVCDLPSMYLLAEGKAIDTHYELLKALTTELYRTGAPFDSLLLSQLPAADLDRYRLLIFVDTLTVTPEMRALIRQQTRDRAVLWLWAPGISDGQGFGPKLVEHLTGFRVALRGSGVPVASVKAGANDPLVAGLALIPTRDFRVERTAPVTEALNATNWFNPRGEDTMREQYTAFEWDMRDNVLCWNFETKASWTDLHLKCAIPACDGIRVTVVGEEGVEGASLRVVIKDAQSDEFVSPRQVVPGEALTLDLSLADFTKAPWRVNQVAEVPLLPLTGLKFVVDGISQGRGTLLVSNLAAVFGQVMEREERIYKAPGGATHLCLVVDDPRAKVLGQDSNTGASVLACHEGSVPGRRQVLSTFPFVPRELLTALMDEAKVHRYVDSPDVVLRADSGLIALHTAKSGERVLHLPRAATLRNALTGQVSGRGTNIKMMLPGPSTTLLAVE